MSDIFISYSRKDQAKAELLAEFLESHGYSVWWDRYIPPGKTFDEAISMALDNTKCVIVLWSNSSVKSNWVKEEASVGMQRNILVPVLIDDVEIPIGFRRVQAAKLIDWEKRAKSFEFNQILDAVKQFVELGIENSSFKIPAKQKSNTELTKRYSREEYPAKRNLWASGADIITKQPSTLAQFPRRVISLLVAFGIASVLLTGLREPLLAQIPPEYQTELRGSSRIWEISLASGGVPIADLIATKMPKTFLLLGLAFGLAFLLAIFVAYAGALMNRLEQVTGQLGSGLKGLARLGCLFPAAIPIAVLSMFLAIQSRHLPYLVRMNYQETGNLSDSIQYLILPAFTLALLPGVLAAQVITRELPLAQKSSSSHVWLARVFKLLGLLLGQIGGWLTAIIVVETIFNWSGLGDLFYYSVIKKDYPTLLVVLSNFAGIILGGRLAAELFLWLEGRINVNALENHPQVIPNPWRESNRKVWVVLTLLLLIVPLGILVVGGLNVDSNGGLEKIDVQSMLGITVLAAIIALIPALAGGVLTGVLSSQGKLWTDFFADLLLLPADVLIFFPALAAPLFIQYDLLSGEGSLQLWLGVAAVLLPRALHIYKSLWTIAPETRKRQFLGLVGSGVLLLGMMFAGLGLVTAVEILGSGSVLMKQSSDLYPVGFALWVCAAAFYLSTDALVGFFNNNEPLVRLNE